MDQSNSPPSSPPSSPTISPRSSTYSGSSGSLSSGSYGDEVVVATFNLNCFPIPPSIVDGEYSQSIILPDHLYEYSRHFINETASIRGTNGLVILKISNRAYDHFRFVTLSSINTNVSDCFLPAWIMRGLRIEDGQEIKVELISPEFVVQPIRRIHLKPLLFTNDMLSFALRNGQMFQRQMRDWLKKFQLIQFGDNLPFCAEFYSTFRVIRLEPEQLCVNNKDVIEIIPTSGDEFFFEIIFEE